MIPPLATAYAPLEPSEPGGMPLRAATEATFTIAPPCFFRCGDAARAQWNALSRLAARIVRQSDGSQLRRPRKPRGGEAIRSCSVIPQLPPTALTRMSMRENFAIAESIRP